MLGEEEGLSGDLTGPSSGQQSDRCGRTVRSGSGRMVKSGSGNNLSSYENELLHKRNPKEGREWMQRWIMWLPTPFIWQRREGRRYR
jgi:hypothetical protein